ncbi:MAG: hemin uptake protein HemP [Xanthobacteraceae bacterium]|nr:hemin uptake protein HemP [Hyphomicrobiales bacterium]MBN8985797.1 hemin uptake protein HemP [Hyphomicrobiales bacterium]
MSKTSQENDRNPKDREATISVAARTITARGNTLDSKELFSGGREIIIVHGAENYRLRLTSQNKLILTK